jgi:hypothetical protein
MTDKQYYKQKKYNKPIVGLFLGLIMPLILFSIIYLNKTKGIEITMKEYVDILVKHNTFLPIFSACVLPNLGLYFLFKKLDYWYSIKGVISSIFIYTLIVLVLKFS